MLRTPHTFISTGGSAGIFSDLWEKEGPLIPWTWGGKSFLLARDPEASLQALRSPALQRTWQLELALGTGVLASPSDAWKEGRGVAKNLFADSLVPRFCAAALHSLDERMDTLAQDGKLELFSEISRIALGAFTQYAFGSVPNDEEWQGLQGIQKLLIRQVGLLNFPSQTTASEFLSVKQSSSACTEEIDQVIDGMLTRCVKNEGEPPEFVRQLQEAEEGGSLRHSTARSQMRNVLVASFLTTGILLTNAIREAILQKGMWKALGEEATGAPALESPRSAADLQRPLATAAIDETARLFPPVWFIGREAVQDVELSGQLIPAGTIVHIVMLAHHRDPDLWEEPLRWDPNRFRTGAAPAVAAAYLPFLTGRHICLGQSFAHAESTLLLSELARRFEIRLVDPDDPIELIDGVVLAPSQPIMATVESI